MLWYIYLYQLHILPCSFIKFIHCSLISWTTIFLLIFLQFFPPLVKSMYNCRGFPAIQCFHSWQVFFRFRLACIMEKNYKTWMCTYMWVEILKEIQIKKLSLLKDVIYKLSYLQGYTFCRSCELLQPFSANPFLVISSWVSHLTVVLIFLNVVWRTGTYETTQISFLDASLLSPSDLKNFHRRLWMTAIFMGKQDTGRFFFSVSGYVEVSCQCSFPFFLKVFGFVCNIIYLYY